MGRLYVAVHAGKPALFEFLRINLSSRLLPNCGGKWSTVFVKGDCLKGVFDVRRDSCVYEGVFFGKVLPETDIWNAQGS